MVFDVEQDDCGCDTWSIAVVSHLPDIHRQKDAGLLTGEEYGVAYQVQEEAREAKHEEVQQNTYRRLYEKYNGQPPVPVEEAPKPFKFEGDTE